MEAAVMIILLSVSLAALSSKMFFLLGTPWGSCVVSGNIVFEVLEKRGWLKRHQADGAALGVLSVLWALAVHPWAGVVFSLVYAGAWVWALQTDLRVRTGNPGCQERRFGADEVPLPHPRLLMNIRGPVLRRGRTLDLGDWPKGHCASFQILVLNPTILPAQFPLRMSIESTCSAIRIKGSLPQEHKAPQPGQLVTASFELEVEEVFSGPAEVTVTAGVGSYELKEVIRLNSAFDPTSTSISATAINRWRGGALAGFAWRGDMDLYDPGTLQSVEGLRPVLEVSRRYRVPSSMYLSGRLSLDKEEHRRFCEKLGVDRNTEGIDEFIRFMKEEVTLEAALDFPFDTTRKYAMELGNHMYLHYGTHSAMAEGNNWKMGASMGDGHYPWQSGEEGSLAEQRDNARHNARVIEEKLGFQVKSWAAPSRAYDKWTAKAVEAAGMLVGSNTNASTLDDLLRLRPPHHPKGCERLVEINKKYPGDPENVYKLAMLKYWMGVAVRKRRAFVYMTHHHALRYKGNACMSMTEEILRHAIQDYKGDFYITTVYGLGEYWDRVLCPKHKWVKAEVKDGSTLAVTNSGDENLEDIPIEVSFCGGKKMLVLMDLPPEQTTVIPLGKS